MFTNFWLRMGPLPHSWMLFIHWVGEETSRMSSGLSSGRYFHIFKFCNLKITSTVGGWLGVLMRYKKNNIDFLTCTVTSNTWIQLSRLSGEHGWSALGTVRSCVATRGQLGTVQVGRPMGCQVYNFQLKINVKS